MQLESRFTRRVTLSLATAAVAATVGLAGCSSPAESEPTGSGAAEPTFTTVTPGTLTVAPYGSSPPAIIQEGGQLSGLLGNLFTGFAEHYGLELETFETDFTGALAATQQGRADVTPFIYHTDERATTVYYTSSIFQLPAAVITHDDFEYDGPESLDTARVGAVVGQVWAPYLTEALGDNAVLFQSAAEAGTALVNGQIDAYVNSALQMYNPPLADRDDLVAHLLSDGDFDMPPTVITNIAYNVVPCNNPDLAVAMNEYLEELEDSGEWTAMNEEVGFSEEFQLHEFTVPEQGCGE
jgi:polar amino acid transport system substrate-binding protein